MGHTQGVKLTPAGHILAGFIHNRSRELVRLRGQMDELKSLERGHVSIGTVEEMLGGGFLPRAVAAFSRQHADLTYEIIFIGTDGVVRAVAEDRCDIGIAFEPRANTGVEMDLPSCFTASALCTSWAMKIPSSMPRLKGFRFPREIVAYAVWAYHRFALSTADVEDLLAERGVMVSREAVRLWVNRFGAHFAACIRRDRPRPNDKWHMDEVVIPINGVKHWLWRAVDANGDALDILVRTRRNAKAAKRFLTRLIARFGQPRVVITDKLRGYTKPIAHLAPGADHRAHKDLNNRIEGSHRPA